MSTRFEVMREMAECATTILDQIEVHTSGHAVGVAGLAAGFAHHLGLPLPLQESLYLSGMFHDVGATTIPHHIYIKSGALTVSERTRMETHAALGGRIVDQISPLLETAGMTALGQVGRLIRHHHEAWDGTGYPDRLLGDEFTTPEQILAISDLADTLSRERPYRKALPAAEVDAILAGEAGGKFDPELVSSFMPFLEAYRKDPAAHDRRDAIRAASESLDDAGLSVFLMAMAIVLASLVGQKVPYLSGQAPKVARLALEIGKAAGMDRADLLDLQLAAFLSDIGILAQPEDLYLTTATLSSDQRAQIELHPLLSEEAVAHIRSRPGLTAIVRHHHEAWDGSGYPDSLSGEHIPLASRIIRLADTYVALQHRRPWRQAADAAAAQDALRPFEGAL
ncbi:HD domain-containing protein, partial [bacterium]|nr:HD domain-containing protein [bacterium]